MLRLGQKAYPSVFIWLLPSLALVDPQRLQNTKNKGTPRWSRAHLLPRPYRCAKSQSPPNPPKKAVLSEFLSVSALRDTSPWRSRRPTQAPGGRARSPPHCGAHSGQAVRGNRVNSHENSDKWAPPPLPPPSIKAKLSQARCRNHFQARHDINISVIRGGQWGVRD